MREYSFILIMVIFSIFLATVLFTVSFMSVTKSHDLEKITPYECGFDPFMDTRSRFEVRFYLVAILLIIFDLEVVFLFPFATVAPIVGTFGFIIILLFLLILTIGFVYEWLKGALDWE